MSEFQAADHVLVYLITQELDGPPERKLAARFLLDCLRRFRTREQIENCLHQLEDEALLDVGNEARKLAASIGLGP